MSLTSKNIRKAFLDFFQEQGHLIVPSAPIVVKDDPTLMFTNAGMNQFKDIFLGQKQAPSPRVADTQKCLRVSGKHNDLEEVGHDTYHHTMFEMLGNWSFGEYYKKEAIEWAWKLLTDVLGIDKGRMYVTVFGGDAEDKLESDVEAEGEWAKWIEPSRILRQGKKDNFWEMGETGPCGPCSEIHVDIRKDEDRQKKDGKELVNNDHPEVIEIWNLVFMEFNRLADKSLSPLPAKSVDTGMGFERLCMVLQGVRATYDIDLFKPIKDYLENKLGCKYDRSEMESIAMRVVMDHIRTLTFSIADGQIPSNTGAGYVIRRILRRASRYGFQYLRQSTPFLFKLVDPMVEIYDDVFPEVKAQRDFIKRIIEEEEKSFLHTLEQGTRMFEDYISSNTSGNKKVDGEFAFLLYDTFGFPIDLTEVMAREKGWTVDLPTFEAKMEEQKNRSRKATEVKTGDWVIVKESPNLPLFVGYDELNCEVNILQYRTLETKKGKVFQVVLDQTPFYAEGGGEIGDTGIIFKGNEKLTVLDTKRENELIVHFTDILPIDPNGEWYASVDGKRRNLIRANHSATHLLHAALRDVLGKHVEQRGSLVAPDVLRFDFSHFAKMTDEEIARVEQIVNDKIAESISLDERRNVPIDEAKSLGAMALFGEKYGDKVRVIVFDPKYSVELCGGCHVKNTSDIRLFRIVSESSIAAGIRRVEALTSEGAIDYLEEKAKILEKISTGLKNPKDILKSFENLLAENEYNLKLLEKLNREKVNDAFKLISNSFNENYYYKLFEDFNDPNSINLLSQEIYKKNNHTFFVTAATHDNKTDNKKEIFLKLILPQTESNPFANHVKQFELLLKNEFNLKGGGKSPFFTYKGDAPKNLTILEREISKFFDLIKNDSKD